MSEIDVKLFPSVLVRYWERRRVADSGGINPDPTFQEKPDPIPTVKKTGDGTRQRARIRIIPKFDLKFKIKPQIWILPDRIFSFFLHLRYILSNPGSEFFKHRIRIQSSGCKKKNTTST